MRAHWRPSLIAQTISDWPRRASPAANTPSTEVVYGLERLDVAARVVLDAELVEQLLLGVQEAHRQQHELRGQLALGARDRARTAARGSAWAMCRRRDAAVAVVDEARGRDRVVLLADAGSLGPPPSRS